MFKDELGKLLPHDEDAKRLAQSTYHFAEFFEKFDVEPPPLERKAFVWGHCHHKATGGIDPEVELLKKMGVEVETLKAGCCGLAGSWGFEAGHHDVSMRLRRAGAAAQGARARRGDAGRRRRLLLQDADRAGRHGAAGAPRRAGAEARARARRLRARPGPGPSASTTRCGPKPSLPRRAARAAVLAGAAALALGFVSATMRRREAP